MGTIRVSETNSSPATTFWVEGDLLSQSIDGNYSTVRCYLAAKNGPGGTTGSGYGGDGYQQGTVVGVKAFATRSASSNFLPSGYKDGATRWYLGPYDVQVPHAADGTHAPITFGMVLNYGSVDETRFSGPMSLPTIPRATVAQLRVGSTTVSSVDVGADATVYLPRASSAFTHTVELWEYGVGATAPVATLATGAGVSAAWTPAVTLAAMFPDALSKKFFLRTITYNGSTYIGATDLVITLTAPASMVPTISGINVADDNPAVASTIGALVQGQSRLKATVVASGVQGSTITSSMVTVDGQTVPSGQSLPLPQSGARAVAGAVTDSRGRTASSSGTVTVLPYDLPQINDFSVQRATSAGVPSSTGTYLLMTLTAAVSSLINGTQKNAMTVTVATRARGTTAWTTRNVITPGLAYNTSVLVSGGGIFAANAAWDVRVTVADKLTSSADFFVAPTAGAIMNATATQQAFGKMVEDSGPTTQFQGPGRVYDGDLDVDGDVRHRGGYAVEPVGIVTAFAGVTAPPGWLLCDGTAVSRTTYANLFAALGTTFGAGNGSSTFNLPDLRGRVPVGRDTAQPEFDVLGEKGGSKTHTLTVDQMPAHNHQIRIASTVLNYINGTKGTGSDIGGFTGGSGSAIEAAANGGGQAHPNLQPYIVLNHIIKAF